MGEIAEPTNCGLYFKVVKLAPSDRSLSALPGLWDTQSWDTATIHCNQAILVIERNIDVPSEPTLAQMERAMAAVKRKEMSIRGAAKAFGVSRSSLHRRVTGQVPMNAKPRPEPILTDGEVQRVLKAVDARTKRGLCFTRSELSMFIRQVVEESPYTREISATFPSVSWTNNFIQCNKSHFSRRQAQSLEVCRAKASTVENVDIHFNNLMRSLKAVRRSLPLESGI
ncbi:unnamed protein product [Phytophthora fragariaefolia]|uniref:Unnamed protein product n=1 Tax=Phytophthora fragariaefolia TaxID=1490495 RepID=A0A9W6U5E6_9STRA|nr:unnamed protein product [Phytophthora fragariaefolia]